MSEFSGLPHGDIWSDQVGEPFSPLDFQASLDNYPMEAYPEKDYQDYDTVSAEPWSVQASKDSLSMVDFTDVKKTHIDDMLRDVLEAEGIVAAPYVDGISPPLTELGACTPAPTPLSYDHTTITHRSIQDQVQTPEYCNLTPMQQSLPEDGFSMTSQLNGTPLPSVQVLLPDALPSPLPKTPQKWAAATPSAPLPFTIAETCQGGIPTVIAAASVKTEVEAKVEVKKSSRRQRKAPPPKEKLYDRKEPYSDPKLEKRRLDAIKSKEQRNRDKKHRQELEQQISVLRKDLKDRDEKLAQKDRLLTRYKTTLNDIVAFHEGFQLNFNRNDIHDLL